MHFSQPQKSFLIFVLLLLFYLIVIEYLIQYTSFASPLQILETNTVASTQGLLGVDVHANGEVLYYPDQDLHLVVGPLCTGIREMFLFALIIMPFGALAFRKKLWSLAIFLPIILLENIFRLGLLYPIASNNGVEVMYASHDLMWTYGQITFLILLLFAWFYFFASPRIEKAGNKHNKADSKDIKL